MIELSIIINRIKVTFISNQTHTFSPLFKIDANYSVYSFKVFIFQNDTQMFTSVISLLTVTQHMFKHHWYKNVLKHVFIKGNVDFYGQHGWIRGSYMYLNNFNTT